MAKQERSKKSTVSNSIKTMEAASTKIEPTISLTDAERSHFDRVTMSRESETWSPHDLTIAGQLAKALARLEEAQNHLDRDGLMLTNERGTQIAHPLLSASMTMASTVQALTRTLGLGASQRGLSGHKQAGRNQAEQSAREVIKKVAGSDLLA